MPTRTLGKPLTTSPVMDVTFFFMFKNPNFSLLTRSLLEAPQSCLVSAGELWRSFGRRYHRFVSWLLTKHTRSYLRYPGKHLNADKVQRCCLHVQHQELPPRTAFVENVAHCWSASAKDGGGSWWRLGGFRTHAGGLSHVPAASALADFKEIIAFFWQKQQKQS